MKVHFTEIEFNEARRMHRAVCKTCGWTGILRGTEQRAIESADRHKAREASPLAFPSLAAVAQ